MEGNTKNEIKELKSQIEQMEKVLEAIQKMK